MLADKKKEIYDADIEALVVHGQILAKGAAAWTLEALSTTSGTGTLPVASVALVNAAGERKQGASAGDGPVDAVFKAIEQVTGIVVKLRDYQIASISTGEDAQGEVTLECEHASGVYRGRALSTDIIEGSARAFLEVINRVAAQGRDRSPPRRWPRRGPRSDGRRRPRARSSRRSGTATWSWPRPPTRPAVLYVDLHLVHEVTCPQAFSLLRERGPAGAPARPDAGHHGPLHADAAAPRRRPLALHRRAGRGAGGPAGDATAAEFGVELHGLGTEAAGRGPRHRPGAGR